MTSSIIVTLPPAPVVTVQPTGVAGPRGPTGPGVDEHAARTDNPHGVTAAQIGAPTVADLTAEATARAAADVALSTQVASKAAATALTAETSARTAADSALASDLTAEATARAAADAALSTQVASKADATALTAETAARTAADSALAAQIATKATSATTLAGYGITDAYTTAQADAATDARIQAVVGAAPAALDTLSEIAARLEDDGDAVAALSASVSANSAAISLRQMASATLDALSDLTTTVFGRSLLSLASAAALRTAVALPTATAAGRLARYTDTAGGQGQTAGLYETASGQIVVGLNPTAIGSQALTVWDYGLHMTGGGGLSSNLYYDAGWKYSGANYPSYCWGTDYGSTAVRLWTAPPVLAGGAATITERLTIDTVSGNVGIGTTAPANRLHVAGDGVATGAHNAQVKVQDTRAAAYGVGGGVSFFGSYVGTTETVFAAVHSAKENSTQNEWGAKLVFATRQHGSGGLQPRMQISGAGDVAIGLDTTPVCKLDVDGPIRSGATYTVATLPAATLGDGMRAFVNDAAATLAAGLGNVVTGGGSNYSPVYSHGGVWRQG